MASCFSTPARRPARRLRDGSRAGTLFPALPFRADGFATSRIPVALDRSRAGSVRTVRALASTYGSRRRDRRVHARAGDRAPPGMGAGDRCGRTGARLSASAMARGLEPRLIDFDGAPSGPFEPHTTSLATDAYCSCRPRAIPRACALLVRDDGIRCSLPAISPTPPQRSSTGRAGDRPLVPGRARRNSHRPRSGRGATPHRREHLYLCCRSARLRRRDF